MNNVIYINQLSMCTSFAMKDPFFDAKTYGREYAIGSSDLSCPLVSLFDEIEWEMLMENTNTWLP